MRGAAGEFNRRRAVQRGGRMRRNELSGGAAYEIGMRQTDHGIPVQPYPDG